MFRAFLITLVCCAVIHAARIPAHSPTYFTEDDVDALIIADDLESSYKLDLEQARVYELRETTPQAVGPRVTWSMLRRDYMAHKFMLIFPLLASGTLVYFLARKAYAMFPTRFHKFN